MQRISKHVNHNYFSQIDSERKAYFLGLIYADGSIIIPKEQPGKQRQKQLCIALQEDDKYILEELCKDIKPKKSINIVYAPNMRDKGWKKRATFKVSSDEICNDLIALGCGPNKSKVGMDFPPIKPAYIRHFIRGFFDGDGCLYVRKVKNRYERKTNYFIINPFKEKLRKRFTITSTSKSFLERCLSEIDRSIRLIGKPYWQEKKRTMVIHNLNLEHQTDIISIQNYFYRDATIFMQRKFEKFNMSISSQATDTSVEGSTTT